MQLLGFQYCPPMLAFLVKAGGGCQLTIHICLFIFKEGAEMMPTWTSLPVMGLYSEVATQSGKNLLQ